MDATKKMQRKSLFHEPRRALLGASDDVTAARSLAAKHAESA
jgi:hypothetical protein